MGPYQLRGNLNRLTFLRGGSDGERLFGRDQHPGPAGDLSQGQGSHGATNLIVGCGLTSAPGPAGVSVCCCVRRSLGLSSPRHGAGSVPWYFLVTGKPATGLCLASGGAAGLPAAGAIG